MNRPLDKRMLACAFGWSWRTWSKPVIKSVLVNKALNKRNLKILEIGASGYSIVSLIYDNTISEITVGFYDDIQKYAVNNKLKYASQSVSLQSNYTLDKVDAFNIKQKYDVIIMRSVLGGLFRTGQSNINDANIFITNLCEKNLNHNGILISLDNGVSFYDKLIARFGARRNNWRFFHLGELSGATEQTSFGLLASFSSGTRLGTIGNAFDTIVFGLDSVLCLLVHFKPTVICSVFSAR